MKTRMIFSLGLSALTLGGTMVGCTAHGGGIASASDSKANAAAKQAARDAAKATRALARRDNDEGIRFAEAAVNLAPRDVGYRLMLAHGYLQAGRFISARTAFADVLELTPDNGRAALNLALAEVATGDWAAARRTLDEHGAAMPVSDRGLALALAGNPAGAVEILTAAARTPGADAKVRQNLALSLALAGNWAAARVVAAADMSPADVDARMQQWAAFAQPKAASDQVASLLGVSAVADSGQPVALALNGAVPMAAGQVETAEIGTAEIETAEVGKAQVGTAPTETAQIETPAPAAPAAVTATGIAAATPTPPMLAKVTFGPSSPVVQPLPTMLLRARPASTRLALGTVRQDVPAATPVGEWYVQLGAFSNVGIAKAGWARATKRFTTLASHRPTGTRFMTRQGALYRLSVGSFSRSQADQMCASYRATGGACFVRRHAGDQMAQWLRTPVQMASR